MPELDWKQLSRTGIPLSVIVLLAMATPSIVNWFTGYHADFITIAAADEKIEKKLHELEETVKANTNSVKALEDEVRIRFAIQRVESLEARLYVLKRDHADPDLIHEVSRALATAIATKDCLVAGLHNCDVLERGG